MTMNDDTLRRLILNLNASSILAAHLAAGQSISERDINRSIQTAQDVDRAVVKRLRWEARAGERASERSRAADGSR